MSTPEDIDDDFELDELASLDDIDGESEDVELVDWDED
jgi:hypothetical protein